MLGHPLEFILSIIQEVLIEFRIETTPDQETIVHYLTQSNLSTPQAGIRRRIADQRIIRRECV